ASVRGATRYEGGGGSSDAWNGGELDERSAVVTRPRTCSCGHGFVTRTGRPPTRASIRTGASFGVASPRSETHAAVRQTKLRVSSTTFPWRVVCNGETGVNGARSSVALTESAPTTATCARTTSPNSIVA